MNLNKTKNLLVALVFSAYVLPYPGFMPGNKIYRLKQIADFIGQYWAFGSLTRHKYELGLADKKLIEAKTLFEYDQYPLAISALSDSSLHFQQAGNYLTQAEKEGKDITQKGILFKSAAQKHIEVLKQLELNLPENFLWQPEKESSTSLNIKDTLEVAIKIREI
jgi:hypothetical protein